MGNEYTIYITEKDLTHHTKELSKLLESTYQYYSTHISPKIYDNAREIAACIIGDHAQLEGETYGGSCDIGQYYRKLWLHQNAPATIDDWRNYLYAYSDKSNFPLTIEIMEDIIALHKTKKSNLIPDFDSMSWDTSDYNNQRLVNELERLVKKFKTLKTEYYVYLHMS